MDLTIHIHLVWILQMCKDLPLLSPYVLTAGCLLSTWQIGLYLHLTTKILTSYAVVIY